MLSKDTKFRLTHALTSDKASKELSDYIEETKQELDEHKVEADPHSQYALKPKIFDCSVNMAKTYFDHEGSFVLEAPKRNTGQVSGNFVGGGTGNKPMAGIRGFDNLHISQLPKILAEVEIRSKPTAQDADERQDGLAFNVLIDLQGNGNPSDFKVINITNTLNGITDKYGKQGTSASVTDFDINGFEEIPGYVSGAKAPFLKNHFYVVAGLASYVPGTNFPNNSGTPDNAWSGIPMNLDVLLNGGVMPLTGAEFSFGYPNCKIISAVAYDGGHPAAIKLPGLIIQIGDSGTNLKSVTAVTKLSVNDINLLPDFD